MNFKSLNIACLVVLLVCVACAHKDKNKDGAPNPEAESAKAQKLGKGWDYQKIREARAAEAGTTPPDVNTSATESNCRILSKEQMIRSKAQGCRPADVREGLGEEMYCCK